jgi:urease accessory protein
VSHGSGSLTIAACRAGPRTILERVRFDGISRCSRAFADGDAARVMLSQLGPGVVRGDRITTGGVVRAGAHLIVTNQAATRLMGGGRQARAEAAWSIEAGALLELIGEPLVALADSRYDASTVIDLGPGAVVLTTEIACVPAGANVRLRTSIRRRGRELFYDALEPAAAAPYTVGTFALAGLAEEHVVPLVAALDHAADAAAGARLGVGALQSGVVVRMLATDIWTVRSILQALRTAARTALLPAKRCAS